MPQDIHWPLTPARKRQLVLACAATVGAVAAYKLYRSERVKSTHKTLQDAADALARYSAAASSASEVVAVLSQDIRQFLASDSDEVPRSLRQLAKLARCSDVQDTIAACVASSIKGVVSSSGSSTPGEPSLTDKIIEAVLSDRGQSLVGLAVRTAAHQSTEAFCTVLKQGVEAALQAAGLGGQQQQQVPLAGPDSPAGGFYSAMSTPMASPEPRSRHHLSQQQPMYYPTNTLHPTIDSALSVLRSPQLLQAVDALVSTCVGSTVGAYMAQASSSPDMLTSVLTTLANPTNKKLVIDIMSQVSATFCREMAAACVAPAAAVASRPVSRLSDASVLLEQGQLVLQQQLQGSPIRVVPAATTGSRSCSPLKQQQQEALLHHSVSEGSLDQDDDAADGTASEPSSPQSGPSTPEPSVAAAEAAAGPSSSHRQLPGHSSYSSLAGSAVAGLILRRQSFSGLLSGAAGNAGWGNGSSGGHAGAAAAVAAAGSNGVVDPAALGPMSTVVSLFVQAARFQEFRSLLVDVSRSTTREFVHSLLPSGWVGAISGGRGGNSSSNSRASQLAVTAALYKVYSAISVLLFLMVYALGPKAMLEHGAS